MEEGVTVEATYEGYVALQMHGQDRPGPAQAKQAHRKVVVSKFSRSESATRLPKSFREGYHTQIILMVCAGSDYNGQT